MLSSSTTNLSSKNRTQTEVSKRVPKKLTESSTDGAKPPRNTKEKPPTSTSSFTPDHNDQVDVMLNSYLQEKKDRMPQIKKIDWGKYVIGTNNKVNIRMINGRLVVRVGGGWMRLEEYMKKYETSETIKVIDESAINPPKSNINIP